MESSSTTMESLDRVTQMIGEALKDCSNDFTELYNNKNKNCGHVENSQGSDEVNYIFVQKASPTKNTSNAHQASNEQVSACKQLSLTEEHSSVTCCRSPEREVQHSQPVDQPHTSSTPPPAQPPSSSRFKLSKLLKNGFDLFISKENFSSTSHDDDFDCPKPHLRSKTISHTKSAPELSRPEPTTSETTLSCNNNVATPSQCTTMNDVTLIQPTESTSNPLADSTANSSVSNIVKSYYSIENILDHPDGRSLLREFMKKRCNEELFLYLEVVRAFEKIIKQSEKYRRRSSCCDPASTTPCSVVSPYSPVDSPRISNILTATNAVVLTEEFLKLKEFKLIYEQFVSLNSPHCMNIDHAMRDRLDVVYKQMNEKSNTDGQQVVGNQSLVGRSEILLHTMASSMFDKISESLNMLRVTIELQFKNEIFPQFKKTQEFQNLILSKMIEQCSENTMALKGRALIEMVLVEYQLQQVAKFFRKRKLVTMSQIQDYSVEDFKNIGISKIRHVQRLCQMVKNHFSTSKVLY
ncbi:hypothetical protein C9374_004085 [Naegleria lovaniensis]|uniref:RGS domain-containing protein n=1 Tax=Naegleria lovaniensis TaxID=51637 RepID=A0AA88GLZ2_NAELO|nr:uncharacterized protein C9374_004085 [Naegleria lovaniensis]KAG2383414.1 hypothetical protein C9374_004085 [Naegleria lovaniensis]